MYLLYMLQVVGILTASTEHVGTEAMNSSSTDSYGLVQGTIFVDSTGANTTLWTQWHESIAYSPSVDGIQIVNRGYAFTGILNVHQIPGDLSFVVHDNAAYDASLGFARYPTSITSDEAHISLPTLGDSWGYMVAVQCSAGWYSGSWDSPVDVGPNDVDVHKCIGKQLPDGNILFIGVTVTDMIIYRVWNASLTNQIASGTLAIDVTYWGFDINGGIGYVFYYDTFNDTLIYYRTTSDGMTWSAEQIWSLAFTPPYLNTEILLFRQVALTDDGQPRLVFNAIDGDDPTYPWYGKIYLSHTSGVPPFELTAALGDTETVYPTVACGGGKSSVIFNVPRNNLEDSLTWWDIHYCYSTDNGFTWSTPINLTQSSPSRIGLQQIAKRVDTLRNEFFYIYCTDMIENHDPLFHIMFDPEALDPMYIFMGYASTVGVGEDTTRPSVDMRYELAVYPNPCKDIVTIQCSAPHGSISSELQIYDTAGRLIRSSRLTHNAQHTTFVSWDGTDNQGNHLPAGVYFVRLQTAGYKETKKVILLN